MADLLETETRKRDRQIDPVERWRLIRQAIDWAEQQATVRRNTPSRCVREQARKNAPRVGQS
jgi:hypothetical protein